MNEKITEGSREEEEVEYFAVTVENMPERMHQLKLPSREDLADWAGNQVVLSVPWETDQRQRQELLDTEYEKVLSSDVAFAEWLRRYLADVMVMPAIQGYEIGRAHV